MYVFSFCMIHLDGSMLSGGGQIIRAALALSAHTNKPFRITNIRHARPRPGLMAQHLEAVRTMQILCNADVEGGHLGSTELTFIPRGYTPQNLSVHIGTAGSITLLTQALSLCAMHHKKVSFTVHGGTDVKWSPSFDYFAHIIIPSLQQFGHASVDLRRRGFYPKGGGEVTVSFGLKKDVKPLMRLHPGVVEGIEVFNTASRELMADNTLEALDRDCRLFFEPFSVPVTVRNAYVQSLSPGFVCVAVVRQHDGASYACIGADMVADPDTPTHVVARTVSETLKERLESGGVVDEHLADHLIPFMGLYGGEMVVCRVSNHIKACIAVTELFTKARFSVTGLHVRVSIPSV